MKIKTIKQYGRAGFETEINELIREGYKVLSTGCQSFDGDADDPYWWAILEKDADGV